MEVGSEDLNTHTLGALLMVLCPRWQCLLGARLTLGSFLKGVQDNLCPSGGPGRDSLCQCLHELWYVCIGASQHSPLPWEGFNFFRDTSSNPPAFLDFGWNQRHVSSLRKEGKQ
jgi:hypothetical protein